MNLILFLNLMSISMNLTAQDSDYPDQQNYQHPEKDWWTEIDE